MGDWLDSLSDAPSWETVRFALEQITSQSADHPEYDSGDVAMAAAEVVAAGLGKPNSRLDPTVAAWAKANSTGAAALREQANATMNFVREESELRELWNESDEADAWLATVDDLVGRLN